MVDQSMSVDDMKFLVDDSITPARVSGLVRDDLILPGEEKGRKVLIGIWESLFQTLVSELLDCCLMWRKKQFINLLPIYVVYFCR